LLPFRALILLAFGGGLGLESEALLLELPCLLPSAVGPTQGMPSVTLPVSLARCQEPNTSPLVEETLMDIGALPPSVASLMLSTVANSKTLDITESVTTLKKVIPASLMLSVSHSLLAELVASKSWSL
jgi:hypothetical protein